MRARIDVSEIEATTKIRAKYLRALENEEWSLLPGPTFVKSFLRTYAEALGSTAGRWWRNTASPRSARATGPASRSSPAANGGGSAARRRALARVRDRGRLDPGGDRAAGRAAGHRLGRREIQHPPAPPTDAPPAGTTTGTTGHASHAGGPRHRRPVAAGRLGRVRVPDRRKRTQADPGPRAAAGRTTATYHARRFEVTLGNSGVTMVIDGRPRTVPPSSEAIGYSITKTRGRHPLPAGSLPTCQ